VRVLATAKEDVLAIAAGFTAAVLGTLTGSLPVISVGSATHAFIAPSAVVAADGNVLVLAQDDTDTDVIAGTAGLQLGIGVGVSAGLTLIDKDTQAFIASGAQVNGRGNTAGTIAVTDGPVTGLPTELIHGVGVQARSSENVFTLAASGGVNVAGLSGAIGVALLDSDTSAFIDTNAHVNGDQAGANSSQTVNVSATNDTAVFGAGVNLRGNQVAVAGGIDAGIIRNDTAAFVGAGADVRARRDIELHALSQKEIDSSSAGPASRPRRLTWLRSRSTRCTPT
jgi:hypothetical protein